MQNPGIFSAVINPNTPEVWAQRWNTVSTSVWYQCRVRELTSPFRRRRCCVFKLHKNKLRSTNAAPCVLAHPRAPSRTPPEVSSSQWEDIPPKITWPSPAAEVSTYLCAGVADNRQASRPWGLGKNRRVEKRKKRKRNITSGKNWQEQDSLPGLAATPPCLQCLHEWVHFCSVSFTTGGIFFFKSMHDN